MICHLNSQRFAHFLQFHMSDSLCSELYKKVDKRCGLSVLGFRGIQGNGCRNSHIRKYVQRVVSSCKPAMHECYPYIILTNLSVCLSVSPLVQVCTAKTIGPKSFISRTTTSESNKLRNCQWKLAFTTSCPEHLVCILYYKWLLIHHWSSRFRSTCKDCTSFVPGVFRILQYRNVPN